MAERLVVDQKMCDSVKFMLAGGAPVMQVQALLGISPATISRIKSAGYSAEQFMEYNAKRRAAEAQKKLFDQYRAEAEKTAPWKEEDQVEGQLQMVLPEKEPAGETLRRGDPSTALRSAQDDREAPAAPVEMTKDGDGASETDQKKLYRFLAGQFDETEIAICDKLGKIYDMMGQILRAIRKE